jgi:phosphoribosylformylglycinamidine synthase
MSAKVRALIITGFGLNCERETQAAFALVGAEPVLVHLNDLLAQPDQLQRCHLLVFIGGFSYGDHLGAGTVFANRLKHNFRPQLEQFIADGKLAIGICNGFQTMTRLGLLPALDGHHFTPQAALAHNEQGVFRDAWVTLRANPRSPCVFTQGLDMLPLPIRHGEGKFIARDEATLAELERRELVALRYVDPETGESTQDFPANPNGSTHAIAGICDPSGRLFGLMPHPEAYLSPYNHPHWQRQQINGVLPAEGLGARLFRNGVEFAARNLR